MDDAESLLAEYHGRRRRNGKPEAGTSAFV